MRLRQLFSVVAVSALLVTVSGCADELPPVSDKVQEYYEANKSLAPVTRGPSLPVVAFVGDSYSAGAGASAPDKRWTTLVSSQQGWVESNLARGGTGYLNTAGKDGCGLDYCPNYLEMIPDVVAAKPDIVVVSGGRNDRWKTDAEFAKAASSLFGELRAQLPDAKLLVTTPVWDDDKAPAEMVRIKSVVVANATQYGATILDIGEPLSGRPDAVAADGGHPNDLGYSLIADAVNVALTAADFKP